MLASYKNIAAAFSYRATTAHRVSNTACSFAINEHGRRTGSDYSAVARMRNAAMGSIAVAHTACSLAINKNIGTRTDQSGSRAGIMTSIQIA